MDSSFSNKPGGAQTPPSPAASGEAKPVSPAVERFHACRWRKAAENGAPDHCTHRDVLPMAGTTGFVPESWCPDCVYFKAKRSPRKRPEPDSDPSWRW